MRVFSQTTKKSGPIWFLLWGVTLLGGCQKQSAPTPPTQSSQVKAQAQESLEHAGDEKKLAALFPGAKFSQKPLILSKVTGDSLRKETGLRLAGGENEWEAFEAVQNGRNRGWALLSHAELPIGEMHLGLTTSGDFKIKSVVAMERTSDEFRQFVAQFRGKNARQPFQVGKDLKPIPGYPPQFSQAVADTVRRGLWLLEHSFGASKATTKEIK